MNKLQIYSFSILHAVATLLIPVLLLLLGGCLPNETLEPPPEVACEEVEKALNQALGEHESVVEVGDWATHAITITPLSGVPTTVAASLRQIVGKVDLEYNGQKYFEIKVKEKTEVYIGDESTTVFENVEFGPTGYLLCDGSTNLTYHGLKTYNERINVPYDDCSTKGLCNVQTTVVKFGQIARLQSKVERREYFLRISSQMPYISRILDFCVTEGDDVNGQSIQFTQCSTLVNAGHIDKSN